MPRNSSNALFHITNTCTSAERQQFSCMYVDFDTGVLVCVSGGVKEGLCSWKHHLNYYYLLFCIGTRVGW